MKVAFDTQVFCISFVLVNVNTIIMIATLEVLSMKF